MQRQPHRCRAYLDWLVRQRCAAPACPRRHRPPRTGSHPSHHGAHGTGTKPADREAIPLCAWCHRVAWHGRGEIPGAPTDRAERREWLRRVADEHWRRFLAERPKRSSEDRDDDLF